MHAMYVIDTKQMLTIQMHRIQMHEMQMHRKQIHRIQWHLCKAKSTINRNIEYNIMHKQDNELNV